ncbi:GapA-binding peptide SR1P [Staphylospora marina]|nr:GapA-binding peptide SR1P [Staphylospora marina]
MEAIVCMNCDVVIDWVESEKFGTLYGTCESCLDRSCAPDQDVIRDREIA